MQVLSQQFNSIRLRIQYSNPDRLNYSCEVDQQRFQESFRGFYEAAKEQLNNTLFTRFFNVSVSASTGNMNELFALMKLDTEQSLDPYVEKLFEAIKTDIAVRPK